MKQGRNFRTRKQFHHHSILVTQTENKRRLSYLFKSFRYVLDLTLSDSCFECACSRIITCHTCSSIFVLKYPPPFLLMFNVCALLQGSSSISSADLFGRDTNDSDLDASAADLINRISFQVNPLFYNFAIVFDSLHI